MKKTKKTPPTITPTTKQTKTSPTNLSKKRKQQRKPNHPKNKHTKVEAYINMRDSTEQLTAIVLFPIIDAWEMLRRRKCHTVGRKVGSSLISSTQVA